MILCGTVRLITCIRVVLASATAALQDVWLRERALLAVLVGSLLGGDAFAASQVCSRPEDPAPGSARLCMAPHIAKNCTPTTSAHRSPFCISFLA